MSDTRFDPCPCCGGADIRSDNYPDSRSPTGHWFSMCCYGCGLRVANRASIAPMIEVWNRRAGTPVSERGSPCPIFPYCHDQGCTMDPGDCLCVIERDTPFKKLDDIGRYRKIRFHLINHPGTPIPSEWAEWLLTITAAPKDEGVRVHTGNPDRPGWVRDRFERGAPPPPTPGDRRGVCEDPNCDCMARFGHCAVTGRLPI